MEEVHIDEIIGIIKGMLAGKHYSKLKEELSQLYPMDIAEMFDDISEEDCVILFRLLSKDQAAEVFSYLSSQQRKDIVSAIHLSLLNYIFDELYFDDKIDFLEEMPANFVKSLIADAPPEERKLINQFLQFPENSAGGLMTIEYVDLKKDMTVKQALERIKAVGVDKETIYSCYILDPTKKLEGLVSLRRLVLSDEEQRIEDIMNEDIVAVNAADDQEYVADLFKKYDLMAIPVVDGETRMIGIITIDDIVDVIEQENTEDFQIMAAITPSDDEYLPTKVTTLAKRRIIWLLVLMISATFTGGIIARYESLLSTAVILTVYIPMLMDSAGNAGSQSSTLIIRGIALGEIELKNWPIVIWKELRIGLMAGGCLALVNFARMFLMKSADIKVAIVVSVTLIFTIVIAKIIGGTLPIAAKALKLDPAIMAGPLITTIVDVLALSVYFTLATAMLY